MKQLLLLLNIGITCIPAAAMDCFPVKSSAPPQLPPSSIAMSSLRSSNTTADVPSSSLPIIANANPDASQTSAENHTFRTIPDQLNPDYNSKCCVVFCCCGAPVVITAAIDIVCCPVLITGTFCGLCPEADDNEDDGQHDCSPGFFTRNLLRYIGFKTCCGVNTDTDPNRIESHEAW